MKKQKPNNSNDWESRFLDNFCQREITPTGNTFFIIAYNERNPEKYIKFISSELQRERQKVLEEVREIIKNCYWISGNRFTVNGKQEKMIVKHELLSKINKLK